jgi:methylenetetrahydrofolate dehydrogenase (NADP+)/methenyltetrahydrofolate cyclohydrolase
VLLAGADPASHTYVRAKEKACTEAGVRAEVQRLPASISQSELQSRVEALNRDPQVDGVLVQMPLPPHVDTDAVVRAIRPEKDVDGLHPENLGLLLSGTPRFVPATPLGVQRLLVEYGIETAGARVVVCGRSNIVGKPLAALLMQKGKGANATVTVCHTGTRDLPSETLRADILIAATGRPESITADMVRPGAVVIDVGISRVSDPASKTGYRLAGDVEFEGVTRNASAITPVPGGVGPMTIAMLLENVLLAAQLAALSRGK